jgi:hypothetical protein
MKKIAVFVLLFTATLFCKAPPITKYQKDLKTHYYWLKQQELKRQKELDEFLFHLSLRESSHDWKVINKYGYMGLFQIGRPALKDLGIYHITPYKFANNPEIFPIDLQKKVVKRLLKRNQEILKYHWKYVGCNIGGVDITKSGILAAAHLAGAGNVIKFLESNGKQDFADGYGTKITDYLKEFSNYKF